MGWGMKHQPVSHVHKQVMPLAFIGFVVMFISGVLLFWSEAEKCYLSGFFRAKILFLILAGLNAGIFELRTKKTIEDWDIARIVAKWTGIPVSKMLEGEVQKLIQMEDRLRHR